MAAADPAGSGPAGTAAVSESTLAGADRWELALPYPHLDLLPVPKAAGGHRLLLLARGEGGRDPEDRKAQVFAFDLESPTAVVSLTLPAVTRPLELTFTEDPESGSPRPFAITETGLLPLGLDRPRERGEILEHPAGIRPSFPRRGLSNAGEGSLLALLQVGFVALYRTGGDGFLDSVGTHRLPVRAQRKVHSLRLESPQVTLLTRPGGRSPLLAIGPEAHGKRRLRTVLVDPSATAETEPTEAWSLLPAPEEVASSWYAWVDGRPILLVATYSAEKLGIFEKQKLRVFSLRPDRTRKGSAPSLARLTASRRWQLLDPVLSDVDGDGKEDLVILQPEGLGGGKLILEAHTSLGLGRFRQTSRRTVAPVAGEVWRYGKDLSGDGIGDLAAIDEGRILIFRGRSDPRKRLFVERKPRWVLPLGEAPDAAVEVAQGIGADEPVEADSAPTPDPGALQLADLDGDGRAEILVSRTGPEGGSLLAIYRLTQEP